MKIALFFFLASTTFHSIATAAAGGGGGSEALPSDFTWDEIVAYCDSLEKNDEDLSDEDLSDEDLSDDADDGAGADGSRKRPRLQSKERVRLDRNKKSAAKYRTETALEHQAMTDRFGEGYYNEAYLLLHTRIKEFSFEKHLPHLKCQKQKAERIKDHVKLRKLRNALSAKITRTARKLLLSVASDLLAKGGSLDIVGAARKWVDTKSESACLPF
jgi:hypothetical protein